MLMSALTAPTAVAVTDGAATEGDAAALRISVVFNNVPLAPGLKTAWGFAAVVEGTEHSLLFDTGGDGAVLLANMERMGTDPQGIDAVFLSHFHADHTGGLSAFLRRSPHVTVYMPASFPRQLRDATAAHGARVVVLAEPAHLFGRVYSSGPLGRDTEEQALIVDTPTGLVVMTGCAHPGVVEVVREAKRYLGKEIRLLIGGFHLQALSEGRLATIIADLKALGVAQVAPSHCTGERAMALFRQAWGKDFLEGGCGAVIEVGP